MPFALETYSKDAHARALRPGLRLDPMDGQGHGTHCAGVIGAVHNDIGVAGVMAEAKLSFGGTIKSILPFFNMLYIFEIIQIKIFPIHAKKYSYKNKSIIIGKCVFNSFSKNN